MSHGILQHAVSGKVTLQLAYANLKTDSYNPQADDDHSRNQVNQSLDDEFASLLQLI